MVPSDQVVGATVRLEVSRSCGSSSCTSWRATSAATDGSRGRCRVPALSCRGRVGRPRARRSRQPNHPRGPPQHRAHRCLDGEPLPPSRPGEPHMAYHQPSSRPPLTRSPDLRAWMGRGCLPSAELPFVRELLDPENQRRLNARDAGHWPQDTRRELEEVSIA